MELIEKFKGFKETKAPSLVGKRMKRLLIAGILSWVVYFAGSVVDSIFAGQFLGEEALSAVSVITPFYSFIAFVGALFTEGSATLYSKFAGKGEPKRSKEVFTTGLLCSFLFGCIVAAIMYFFKNGLLSIFHLENSIKEYAYDYYDWFIAVAIIYPVSYYVRVLCLRDGDVILPVTCDGIEAVVNFVASLLLVKQLGMKGLGFATFLGITIACLVNCSHFFKEKNSIKLRLKIRLQDIINSITLGLGTSLCFLFIFIVDFILNAFIISKFGSDYMTSYTIINYAITLTEILTVSASSASAFLAAADGARNRDDIVLTLKYAKKECTWLTIILTILVLSLSWFIPTMFGISSKQQYNYSVFACILISLTYVLSASSYLLGIYYASLSNPVVNAFMQIFRNFILQIILPIVLSFPFGYTGFLLGFPICFILSYLIFIIYIKIHYKSKSLYVIPEYGEIQFSLDLILSEKNIVEARDLIENALKKEKIEQQSILKTMLVIEDMLSIILNENKGNTIIDRITISIGPKTIRVLNKDNGKVFNIKKDTNTENNYFLFQKIPVRDSIKSNLVFSFNSVILVINRSI